MAAIYFDLDGTLLTYDKEFKNIFEEGIGFEVDQEVFEFWSNEIIDNLEKIVENPYLEALKSVNEKFKLGLNVEEARNRYIEAELEATVKKQELVKLLKEYSKEHKVGILTNGDGEVQKKKIEKHGLNQFADSIVISNVEGVRKPSPEVFELAKEKLPAEKHIYIGDTFEEDIKPAREKSFKAIHVKNNETMERLE